MCLAIPGKVESIAGDDSLSRSGTVNFGGIIKEVNLAYVPEAVVGDYVIVHVGFAISRLDEAEANKVFEYLKEMNELMNWRTPPVPTVPTINHEPDRQHSLMTDAVPHPDPLRQGEGTRQPAPSQSGSARLIKQRRAIPPLPRGEGRGEGKGSAADPAASSWCKPPCGQSDFRS